VKRGLPPLVGRSLYAFGLGPYWFSPGMLSRHTRTKNQMVPTMEMSIMKRALQEFVWAEPGRG